MIYFTGYVFETVRKTMLYEDDLFGNAFKTKYIKNATTLRIVSGYATPSMLQHHIEAFPKLKIKSPMKSKHPGCKPLSKE